MATFITLITETQLGETHIKESVARATHFKQEAERFGVRVAELYWTLGEFDGVLILEAEQDEQAAAFLHYVASKGTVRTHTLRAFDVNETRSILESLAQK